MNAIESDVQELQNKQDEVLESINKEYIRERSKDDFRNDVVTTNDFWY